MDNNFSTNQSSLITEKSTVSNTVSNKLKSSAHQIEATEKSAIKKSAIITIKALITSRKSPKVIIVMGSVRNIKIGFTIDLRRPKTKATKIAIGYPDTETP